MVPPPPNLRVIRWVRNEDSAYFVAEKLQQIGREPINDLDKVYLAHDLGYRGDAWMENIQNHLAMGEGVYSILFNGEPSIDWYGYLYGAASVPTISGAGVAQEVVGGAIQQARDVFGQSIEVDTVYVIGTAPRNGVIDVFYRVVDFFGTAYDTTLSVFQNTWQTFSSIIGNVFQSWKEGLSNIWDWLTESDNGRAALSNDHAILYDDHNAGEHLTKETLLKFDTNRDGRVDENDNDASIISILDEDGVLRPLLSHSNAIIVISNDDGRDYVLNQDITFASVSGSSAARLVTADGSHEQVSLVGAAAPVIYEMVA